MTLVSVIQRSSSFVGQLFLGTILFEEDYALFAIALGLTSIGAALRSVLQPVLINQLENQPDAFKTTYRTVLTSLWGLTIAGVVASSLLETVLSAPGLQPLLILLLLTMPFQLLAGFGTARISHGLRFGQVGAAMSAVAIARNIATVLFALGGLGAISFALGGAISVAVELLLLSRYTSLTVSPGLLSKQTLLDVKHSLTSKSRTETRRWIWPSALAVALANNGDYTVASLWASKQIVGLYYFAFTLTGAFWVLLNSAVSTVLVPGFVALKSLDERRVRLMETLSISSVVSVLFFNSIAVVMAPMIHSLWDGKWDGAIPAVLVFSVFAPLQFIHPVVQAIARGTAHWSLYFTDIALTAVLTLLAAGIGAATGGLGTIAVLVVGVDVFVSYVSLVRLCRALQTSAFDAIRAATMPWLLGLTSLIGAHLLHPLDDPDISGSIQRLPVFAALLIVMVALPYRNSVSGMVRSILGQNS